MTVGELIEELRKFPTYYTAVIEYKDTLESEYSDRMEMLVGFIGDISIESSPVGNWVKITEDCHDAPPLPYR